MLKYLLPALAFSLTGPALAQDTKTQRMLCESTRLCDDSGFCEDKRSLTAFQFQQVDTDADGAGSYLLLYDDTETIARTMTGIGPTIWKIDDILHTWVLGSNDTILWHQFDLSTNGVITTTYMTCEVL